MIRVIVTPAIYRCFVPLQNVNRHSTEQDSYRVHILADLRDTAFLLNSWAPLVTIGSDFHQSQAFSRSYSSNWPNSLNYHSSMAIGFSPRRPDAVIGTGSLFFRVLLSRSSAAADGASEKTLCLRRATIPLRTSFLGRADSHAGKRPLPPVPRRRKTRDASPQKERSRNVNRAPFPPLSGLGPTNSGPV